MRVQIKAIKPFLFVGLSPEMQNKLRVAYTSKDILKEVAECFGLNKADLLAKSQKPERVFPRSLAMYIMRNKLKMSFPEVGKVFWKHHTTVMHACEMVDNEIFTKSEFAEKAIMLIQKFPEMVASN